MGRKRWWRGGLELLVLCVLLHAILGDGDVGCIFSENLCKPEIETCYNDLAFGRCLKLYDNLENEDLYRYDLEPQQLQLLRIQLENLAQEGYKWPDPYTQCIMQKSLYAIRSRLEYDHGFCESLKQQNIRQFTNTEESPGNLHSLEPIAIVKFMPSEEDPHGDFADELYYPPIVKEEPSRFLPKELDYLYSPFALKSKKSINQQFYAPNKDREFFDQVDEPDSLIRDDNYYDAERQFSRKYKYPEFLQRSYTRPEVFDDSDIDIGLDSLEVQDNYNDDSRQSGIYTEGGLVQPFRHDTEKPEIPDDIVFDVGLGALFSRRKLAGFKRRERLDVKKPGPPFTTNNYAFKTQFPPSEAGTEDAGVDKDQEDELMRSVLVKKMTASKLIANKTNNPETENSYKNVDLDHVYIQFKGAIHTWGEGVKIIEEVRKLLGLEPGVLTDEAVQQAEVTFRVQNNSKGYNATSVILGIGTIIGKLQKNRGVEVVRVGIGSKRKLPPMLEMASTSEMSSGSFGLIVAAGAAAAGAAAVVTLIIARRHAKSRAKLAGLTAPDPEASKDYQDLCRARMQAKQPNEKADSPRIISLSRESESNNSPSSRSSTSSWSEEPALSNMDISTGHMVLSYMEDHLKNKDRLDQEWTALCAYEAEPSSTAIAEDKENDERNRPGAVLPYDHSRVVLNDLANINSSDYINASTITDHDPRNPAYIATQGALPQTAADFWQLVWEQGSVVIVMLTRLTEEGQAMCHRYWPEEGSELYHIYEVHLVSEHIWCDDYLVRSFYLKNLRTGETRTVTQFHFLSWPENGVPHSTKALLEFRRKVNKSYRGRSCPIVVHCSDGAGRTGTYCLIDMVLNRMAKGAKEIDIAATLEHIRDQRPGMVASKQQFEFVLMAVAEEVHAILKALPIPPAEKSPAPTTSNVSPPPKAD